MIEVRRPDIVIVDKIKKDNDYRRGNNRFFKKMGFTPCKAKQPLHRMELQEKEAQKD